MNDEQNNEVAEEVTDAPVVEKTAEDENKEAEISTDENKSDDEDKLNDIEHWKKETEKWRTNSRKNEAVSKQNFSRVKELEAEIETFKTTLSEFEQIKEQNEKLLRKGIALEYGIPAELASRLVGTTEEELKADAEILKNSFNLDSKKVAPTLLQGSDSENLKPGLIRTGKDYEQQFKR